MPRKPTTSVGWHASMLSPQGCATPRPPAATAPVSPTATTAPVSPTATTFPVSPTAASAAPVAPTVAPSAAAAAAAAAQPSQAGTPSPEDRFGLRVDRKEQKKGELTELSATATAISAKPRGELVITLDNGQVWGEIAPGSKIKVKPGDAVKIEAGTLGSFILIAPNGRSSKVTRIR